MIVVRLLRLVRGATALLTRGGRLRLGWFLAGSLLTALLDMLGVAALVPLMQLLTEDRDSGSLGWLRRLLGLDQSDTALAAWLGGGIILAFTLKAVLSLAFRWWQLGFLAKEAVATAAAILRGYLQAPYSLHLQRPIAEMMRILGDGVGQAYGVIGGLLGLATDLITVVGLAGLLLVTNPLPASLALAYLAAASVVINRITGQRSRRAGEQILDANLSSFKASLHSLGGVKEIMLRHNSEIFVGRYRRSQLDLVHARRKLAFMAEAPRFVLELSFVIGVSLLAVVTFATQGSGAALSGMALFVAAGFRILPSVVRIIAGVSGIRSCLPGYHLVLADLRDYARWKPTTAPGQVARRTGLIRFEGVGFRYPGTDRQVLHDITCEIPKGSSLAVVGPSGSGKTTLVNLLLGLLEPTEGQITVGGQRLGQDLVGWQLGIGLVPQPVYVYDGTLRDNVTFGLPPAEVDEDRLHQAIDRAELGELLRERGLDTEIGERGIGISGGQQQRIGLARALYYEPHVLVLDEATSALDNITEHRITETIRTLRGEVTTVVVAHRLSTVRHCDQLIYLDGGTIAAQGTFEQVRRSHPTFARLVELGRLEDPGS